MSPLRALALAVVSLAGCSAPRPSPGRGSTPAQLSAPGVAALVAREPPRGLLRPTTVSLTAKLDASAPGCDPARCGFDPRGGQCTIGAARGASSGPTCACDERGACVLDGFVGPVPCARFADCSCTRRYSPAPARWFPRSPNTRASATTGYRPGDCVASCRAHRCEATQGPE